MNEASLKVQGQKNVSYITATEIDPTDHMDFSGKVPGKDFFIKVLKISFNSPSTIYNKINYPDLISPSSELNNLVIVIMSG